MSIWQYYRGLSTQTRVYVGLGVMGYALFGLFVSDRAEKAFGLEPTEQDKEKLGQLVPKIHTLEKSRKEERG